MRRVRSIDRLTRDEVQGNEGLIVDLDDTVLDHGRLTPVAYAALCRASDEGLPVLVATGRPAGWGEVLARQWPVVGVVTENGSVAFVRVGAGIERLESVDASERSERRRRLDRAAAAMQERFPGLELADDNTTRRSDVTLDIGERARVPAAQVAQMAALGRSWGFRVTVSSVHLHLTLDGDDKASGALAFLHRQRGVDPSRARVRWAFVGDSGNDAPCFAAFGLTFGVANVAPYVRHLTRPPRYVTEHPRGAGFAEVVTALLPPVRSPDVLGEVNRQDSRTRSDHLRMSQRNLPL